MGKGLEELIELEDLEFLFGKGTAPRNAYEVFLFHVLNDPIELRALLLYLPITYFHRLTEEQTL